nr:ATPase domain containing protein [Haemonchus contortus]
MTSRNALRPRQTSTAATVSHTPLKETRRANSAGRRSLPRTAKILSEIDGYKDQLFSPPKRHALKNETGAETPATKISKKIVKLVIRSPESVDENRRPRTPRSAARRLVLNEQQSKVTRKELEVESMEIENDENIPPVGDTVGRRISRSLRGARNVPTQDRTRTPLRMKIKKFDDVAKICESTVRYRSPPNRLPGSKQVSSDACVMPLKTRLRTVLLNNNGDVTYRTVGPESPWGVKRPPARIIPVSSKLNKPQKTKRDRSFDVGELEESSSGEDYSSEESSESEPSDDDVELMEEPVGKQKRKSVARPTIRFKTFAAFSPDKKSSTVRNPRMAVRKVETLEDFRRRLHTSEVPERMPCREEEAAAVEKFIRNAVSTKGTSSAMYISGVPGTGKTATVVSVVKHLSQNKLCNPFSFVYVNAMEFVEPKKIFIAIYNQITENTKRISADSARRKLNRMFEMSDKHRPPIVILVDELDQLCTKKQELIYDIFNWTATDSARVSVMAIANTLDLPERMLSQRISSRIGAARICFQPYEFQQIECIIRARLKGSVNAIDDGAVQFAARKVAAVTGDLRKAMDLLRRAIEIAIEQGSKKLLVEHVLSATREASSTLLVNFVKGLSKHGLLLFRSAVSLAEKRDDFSFAELHAQYLSFATSLEGIEPLIESVLVSLVGQLCSTKLLIQSSGSHVLRRRIRLGMSYQDAQSAIRIRENANNGNA